MSGQPEQGTKISRSGEPSIEQTAARVTVFCIPKPFTDQAIARIQANAIRSWQFLNERAEVLLLGNEPGIESFARENGLRYGGGVEVNSQGTPLVNAAFAQANRLATGDYLLYCNADVILRGDLTKLAEDLGAKWPTGFLALGRRNEVAIEDELDWKNPETVNQRLMSAFHRSRKASRVCKEYFLFRRGQYANLPAFAVGRGNWDNWMVSEARRAGTPVVDVSRRIQALHQSHCYTHLRPQNRSIQPSRWNCYVSGAEARANEELAGGKRLISGSSTDWVVEADGSIRQKLLGRWNADFWLDLPRFVGMSIKLPFQH